MTQSLDKEAARREIVPSEMRPIWLRGRGAHYVHMLVIRLLRIGKKNQPAFKIVITDKRKPPKAGRFVEEVGSWNPLKKEKVLKSERIKYWLSVGAKPSDTIYNMLVSEKIVEGKKIPLQKKSKKKEEEKAPEAPTVAKPTEEKPKEEVKETPVVEKPKEEKPKEEIKKEDVPKEEVQKEEKKEETKEESK